MHHISVGLPAPRECGTVSVGVAARGADDGSIIVYGPHLIFQCCSHWSAPIPVPIAPRLAELLSPSLHP